MNSALERSIKDRLTKLAKDRGKTFAELWQTFFLERFLARLAASEVKKNFIFKGGMLLHHYFPLGRQTMDLDFSIQKLSSDADFLKEIVQKFVSLDLQDGIVFSEVSIAPLAQPHMKYPGFQISTVAILGQSRVKLFIDIACGDPVDAKEKSIELLGSSGKPFFESSITLDVYPLEFIFSEKYETLIRRASLNSRMKDFFDLWNCIQSGQLDPKKLEDALKRTFQARETSYQKAIEFSETETTQLQSLWVNFLRKIDQTNIPKNISDVVRDINSYLINF